MEAGNWPRARPIASARLSLEPLRVEDADALAPVLDDPALHEFIGGEPAPAAELRDRFARQVVGHSPAGDEGWLNWVVRLADGGDPVGTVQATITREDAGLVAELAWVIAAPFQGRGVATEAARALVAWLTAEGVTAYRAHVHPLHAASAGVARGLGLRPTDTVVDGETRWES